MSDKARTLLVVLMLLLLTAVSFGSGYLVNDLIRFGSTDVLGIGREDEFSVFWEAWERVEGNFIGALPSRRELTYGAVRGALSTLNDPYSTFIEPAARNDERVLLRGNIGGVGALISRNEDGALVLSPIAGNPAEAAGILEGDILLAVDGREVSMDDAVEDVVELIRGEVGTEVALTVLHPGIETPEEIVIMRAEILLPSVTHRILEEAPDVGYIHLSRFSAETAGEVKSAIDDLRSRGAQSLILDLRHNRGGLLDAAVDVSDLFLSEGTILIQVSRDEDEKVFSATLETAVPDMPLVVLINEATASSSEILAGALQANGRATLVGTPTFGKGSVQLVFDLSDGSSVHVTSSRWLTPNRHQLDQNGLQPDITFEQTAEATDNGRDGVLDRAVSFLQSEASQRWEGGS